MDSTRTLPQPPQASRRPTAPADERGEPSAHELAAPVRRAIARTRRWLLEHQLDAGCWCAELEGDTILESEYIMYLWFTDQFRVNVQFSTRGAQSYTFIPLPWSRLSGTAPNPGPSACPATIHTPSSTAPPPNWIARITW